MDMWTHVKLLAKDGNWKRIYFNVNNEGEFLYTFSKKDGALRHFENTVSHVKAHILAERVDGYYILKFKNDKTGAEEAQIRSKEYQSLSKIKHNLEENIKNHAELGRPLTIDIHDSYHISLLSGDDGGKIQLKGLVNLLVLLLITYTVRAMIESYEKHEFIVFKEIQKFLQSGVVNDPANYQTLACLVTLLVFPTISFWIELLASTGFSRTIIYGLIVGNLTVHLFYPLIVSYIVESNPLAATYLMLFNCGQILKLVSFHHVFHDNRKLVRTILKLGPQSPAIEENILNLPKDVYEVALTYPKNLRADHFVRYLLAPTCCYQFIYPTTTKIRVSFLLKRVVEFIFCNTFIVYLFYQHMIPVAKDCVKPLNEKRYMEVLYHVLRMSVPSAYCWLTIFYGMFHTYLNFWAEITYFGDRRFYSDWWNAGNLGEYWRKWNFPIHSFLQRHVYYPLRRRNLEKSLALLLTFLVSAAAHEYIIVGVFRVVNFIAFTLMIVNVPAMILQSKARNVVSANINNLLFWFFYVVTGQPFGIIICYYQFNK